MSFSYGVGQVRSQPNQELHLAAVASELNRGPCVTEQSSPVLVPVCKATRKEYTTRFRSCVRQNADDSTLWRAWLRVGYSLRVA